VDKKDLRMSVAVRQERDGAVAILVIDAPPVNALGIAVRKGLSEGLADAMSATDVRSILVRSEGKTFSAGADIREFGKDGDPEVPDLPELCNRIEASAKPVLVAMQGPTLGGGLELALAAHVRLASPQARFGFPEVALGILPGAGGTQRAPRLIGAEASLRMMLTGRHASAAEALATGLIDGVIEDDLEAAALALAKDMASEGRTPQQTRDRRDGMRDPAGYLAAVAAARKTHAKDRLPAPMRIVDCVEAAQLLPFDQGMAFERSAFVELLSGPESAGLRHAFLAERRTASFPEAKAVARSFEHVGIIGLGRIGSGIALSLLEAGVRVTAVERGNDALVAGLERVAELQERAVNAGRTSAARRDADWDRLTPAIRLDALASADVVVEALPDDPDLKSDVLKELATHLKPDAVIATTSGWINPATIAARFVRSADLVGMHFCAPVPMMRLAEVGVGPETSAQAVATVAALARRMGKMPVRVGATSGLVGNRVQAALRTAADFLLEDGATPLQVDTALKVFGFAMGPYQALDLAGLEKSWSHRHRVHGAGGAATLFSDLGDLLVEGGRFGQETGRGYYLYDQDRAGREDPEVQALLAELRSAKGIVPRPVGSDEIRTRCLSAMANEGARILGEGVVPRATDIDAIMLAGYGFPRWQGGPMFWASNRGLLLLRAELRRYAEQSPDFWQVAPLIDQLIRDGRGLLDHEAS
jgi:3-hydroxyacyl-CoA dehydrogenase